MFPPTRSVPPDAAPLAAIVRLCPAVAAVCCLAIDHVRAACPLAVMLLVYVVAYRSDDVPMVTVPSADGLTELYISAVSSPGDVRFGPVLNTNDPPPVSSVTAVARLALDGVPSHVATPVPRLEMPVPPRDAARVPVQPTVIDAARLRAVAGVPPSVSVTFVSSVLVRAAPVIADPGMLVNVFDPPSMLLFVSVSDEEIVGTLTVATCKRPAPFGTMLMLMLASLPAAFTNATPLCDTRFSAAE